MSTKALARSNAKGLAKLRDDMEKRYGETQISRRERVEPYQVTSTGSLSLDLALRVGGWVEGRIHEIVGQEGVGKGHPVDTRILTPAGWARLGDLNPGDQVIGSDGRPTQVVDVYDRGILPVYRVTMTDKSSVLCDADHLWSVTTAKGKQAVLSVDELSRRALLEKDGSGRYRIPQTAPVQYPEAALEIHPYLMGVLLANGGLSSDGVISTNDTQVVERVRAAGVEVHEKAPTDTARRWYVNDIRPALRALKLWGCKSADKFVPEPYLRASIGQRHLLLQALLDCDGSADSVKGKPSYHTRSVDLARGVQEIVHSLGGNASVCGPYLRDDGGSDYRVNVWLPSRFEPFTTSRKAERRGLINHREPVRKIKSIEPAGEAEVRCIKVAAQDSLYVTECHLVTHNTTIAINSMAQAQAKYPHLACGYIDMEQTFDWDWAERNNLVTDDDHFLHVYPEDSEDVSDQVRMMMATGLFKMVVVDSIGGMESKQAFTKEAEEAVVGRNAQIITRMSKRLAVDANKYQCTALLINQYRANIGNPKGRDLTAGPKSLKYATTTKVELSRTGQTPLKFKFPEDDEPQVVAKEVRARVTRNKVAAEGKKAEFWLINQDTSEFGPIGIDQASEALTIGLFTGVIVQEPGGYYSLPWTRDKKDRLRGRPVLLDYLRTEKARMLEIRDKSVEAMAADVKPQVDAVVETEDGKVDTSTGEVL